MAEPRHAPRPSSQLDVLEILKDIATTNQLEVAADRLVDMALAFSGAVTVSFRLFIHPFTIVNAGSPDPNSTSSYEYVASGLPAGLHSSPPLGQEIVCLTDYWMVAPIYASRRLSGVCWLWLPDQPQPDAQAKVSDRMAAVISAFHLLAARLIAQDQHTVAERNFQALMSHLNDPVVIFDGDWRLKQLNPAAQTLLSVELSDADIRYALDDLSVLREIVALNNGMPQAATEWQSADGRAFQPHLAPIPDASGNPVGWLLQLRDLTLFKKLSRNQSEFIRIVSHDLRSPLTSMQGFASMLEQRIVGELNERQAHFVSRILAGIAQMTMLVDNIQDAGRYDPETGFYELSRSPCDLGEMVHRIVENHLVPAEKDLTIDVKVTEDVPIIQADGNMIERAIINLFDNAVKYTPSGGRVQVVVKRQDEQVVIQVSDTGLGIKPEDQKRLFERHVRLVRPEHKNIKGSGLGLFIVRSVAQRHGGKAWVESIEGQGSTFAFSIPLQFPGRSSSTS